MSYSKARQVFEEYLQEYPLEDEKIKLKVIHTYGVVRCSEEIGKRLCLEEEDMELAKMIGLLHDIGRFEQLKRFNSFEPDTMDHAAYGVKLLFEEGKIRDFVENPQWDSIIRTAIARHSDFSLGEMEDKQTLLHARLIRDADKLDNFRVKLAESVEVLLGISAEEAGTLSISPKIYEDICNERCILSADRKTKMDYWVSYLGHIFDVNFLPTLEIIKEKNYIQKTLQRIPYSNSQTAQQMEQIGKILEAYIEKRCKGNRTV